jgi:ATP-dependent 26S proteasome regulatory subunit
LPDEKIRNFLMSDDSGLIVLNGIPGTGKSSYIRYLINNVDRDFIYMDQSAFDSITDASFMRTLAQYENSVLILEDCETMLIGRLDGNSKITTLLNLTDGILGDSFKFKVICTFNANIGKIDPALLRKGRMKVKYEFKALTAEKTKALAKSIGVSVPKGAKMTLADIYNKEYEVSSQTEKSMGFI